MKNDEKKKNFSYHLQQLIAGQNRTKKQICQDLGIKATGEYFSNPPRQEK